MNGRLPYRAIGVLGLVDILLILTPFLIAPIPPLGPGVDLVAFNGAHRSALMLGNYLGVVQIPIGLIFLIFVAAVTRRSEEASRGWLWLLVFGSALCSATVGAVLTFFFLLSPLLMSLGQSALQLVSQLGLYGLDISYAIQALFLGSVGVAVLRLKYLPAWLGYAAFIAAALSTLGTLGVLETSGPLSATGPVALVGAGLSLPIWILLTSVYWLIHPASHATPALG